MNLKLGIIFISFFITYFSSYFTNTEGKYQTWFVSSELFWNPATPQVTRCSATTSQPVSSRARGTGTGQRWTHTSLTATASSKKLTSQTEHIPALCRCRESVPTQKSNQIGGRFRDHHFCLYFELGCELGPSEAQAQNTSKNDDFKNGPLFDLIFTWELILDILHLQRSGICSVWLVNFSEPVVAVKAVCKE